MCKFYALILNRVIANEVVCVSCCRALRSERCRPRHCRSSTRRPPPGVNCRRHTSSLCRASDPQTRATQPAPLTVSTYVFITLSDGLHLRISFQRNFTKSPSFIQCYAFSVSTKSERLALVCMIALPSSSCGLRLQILNDKSPYASSSKGYYIYSF